MTRLRGHLVVPVYRVDLAEVVDTYVGETEKNLGNVFEEAGLGGGVLLFDEADALFGKRARVKDSHDRYANLEVSDVATLLDETGGVVILATNRTSDIDEAFLRRLRFIVEFPLPGPGERDRIWDEVFPSKARRVALILVAGLAIYVVIKCFRRCRRPAVESAQGDGAETVEQKSSGLDADSVG